MASPAAETNWVPPSFDTTREPVQIGSAELDSCCRSAKFCFDGKSVLAVNEDRYLDVYNISDTEESIQDQTVKDKDTLRCTSRFRQASPIYDTLWYPFSSASNPATLCFLASLRDTPVRLLDASDGRLRASYKIIDHRERFVAPHSLAFNCTAQRFYCGYLDAMEVFDLNVPGEGLRIPTRPTKKSKDGLRGIVSALDFCPDYSGLFAAGTFTSSIGLFSEDTGGEVLMYLDDVPGPISQLRFHPTNPNLLFGTCRQKEGIFIWDVRSTSTLYSSLVLSSASNQRRRFDIDTGGQWLIAGDEEGWVNYFDLNKMDQEHPIFRFRAHFDSVSVAAFHPNRSVLMTVSGSRRFSEPQSTSSGEEEVIGTSHSEDESTGSDDSMEEARREVVIPRARITIRESKMKLWRA